MGMANRRGSLTLFRNEFTCGGGTIGRHSLVPRFSANLGTRLGTTLSCVYAVTLTLALVLTPVLSEHYSLVDCAVQTCSINLRLFPLCSLQLQLGNLLQPPWSSSVLKCNDDQGCCDQFAINPRTADCRVDPSWQCRFGEHDPQWSSIHIALVLNWV